MERFKIVIERIKNEADTSWSRHNYFLVVTSVLIVAFTQSPTQITPNLIGFRLMLCLAGIGLCVIWALMHHRSAKYVRYFKEQASALAPKANMPDFYPKNLGGIETRILGYAFPLMFLAFWVVLTIIIL